MDQHQILRVRSGDGTEIAANVRGDGPPLLLLPAGPGDSETTWMPLVPHLEGHYTCYLLDTRGRGVSADHPDHGPDQLVCDVIACAESIGGPVGLVGWGSCLWALVAAEGSVPIAGVAAYEPAADEVIGEELGTHLGNLFDGVGRLVAENRLEEAVGAFLAGSDLLYDDEDLAGGHAARFWWASAPNLPVFFQEEQQAAEGEVPSPTDPSVLARITAPALLVHGSRTRAWFKDSARYVASHLTDARMREVPGAGHFGPWSDPAAFAEELVGFFDAQQQRTGAVSS
jgi:pimeloyl-ACP methyl ester carboxylesterase